MKYYYYSSNNRYNNIKFIFSGQQFAQQMSQRNPELIEQFRQQMTTGLL